MCLYLETSSLQMWLSEESWGEELILECPGLTLRFSLFQNTFHVSSTFLIWIWPWNYTWWMSHLNKKIFLKMWADQDSWIHEEPAMPFLSSPSTINGWLSMALELGQINVRFERDIIDYFSHFQLFNWSEGPNGRNDLPKATQQGVAEAGLASRIWGSGQVLSIFLWRFNWGGWLMDEF